MQLIELYNTLSSDLERTKAAVKQSEETAERIAKEVLFNKGALAQLESILNFLKTEIEKPAPVAPAVVEPSPDALPPQD